MEDGQSPPHTLTDGVQAEGRVEKAGRGLRSGSEAGLVQRWRKASLEEGPQFRQWIQQLVGRLTWEELHPESSVHCSVFISALSSFTVVLCSLSLITSL